jgi:hypothetical protein
MHGFFAVAGNPLINGYGNKPDTFSREKETMQQQQKCGTVLSPAQGYRNPIPGDNQPPGFYRICNPHFQISDKMDSAEVAIPFTQVNNWRFPAQGTCRPAGFPLVFMQLSSPVCYPYNPDHITRFNEGILRDQLPIPGHNHLKRIYSLFEQYLFDRRGAVIKNPDIFL